MPVLPRRRFLRLMVAGLAGAALSCGYGWEVEPALLRVRYGRIPRPPGVAPGPTLRIAHLSDLHADPLGHPAVRRSAVDAAIRAAPHAIFLTGDFITAGMKYDLEVIATELAPLARAAPTFATFGNHDGGAFSRMAGGPATPRALAEALGRVHIHCLENSSATIEAAGRVVQIVGLGDRWNGRCNPERAWSQWLPVEGAWVVAATHNPDSRHDMEPFPWHLLLTGHTHGGQCGLPWLGRRLAPVSDKSHIQGLFSYRNRQVNISAGVGTLHGVRFLCPPEMTILELE